MSAQYDSLKKLKINACQLPNTYAIFSHVFSKLKSVQLCLEEHHSCLSFPDFINALVTAVLADYRSCLPLLLDHYLSFSHSRKSVFNVYVWCWERSLRRGTQKVSLSRFERHCMHKVVICTWRLKCWQNDLCCDF